MKNKWVILAALCVLFVIYTIDRALLGLLAIPIQEETGMSNVRFGVLSSAIFWSYALVAPFSGLAGDRFNRARVIGFAVLMWSAMVLIAGFAGGFWSLLIFASIAVVVPQTLYSPTASAFIASLHKETRTVAMSCHQAAYYMGWFLSGAVVAGIVAAFGTWRAAYFTLGACGLVAGTVFLILTGRMKNASPVAVDAPKPRLKDSVRAFWGCPSALLAAVGYVAVAFVGNGYSIWGTKFIANKFSISAAAAGTGVMFWHYTAAFAAILVTGIMTDKFVKRFPRFRLLVAIGAFILAIPCLFLFAFGSTLFAAFTGAALLGATFGVLGANQFTNLFDVVPAAHRAVTIGFLNVMAGLLGSLAPMLLGALSQRYGEDGFAWGFAGMSVTFVLSIGAFLISYFFTFNKERIID